MLWVLLAHRGKKPMKVEAMLNLAAIPAGELGQAKHEIDDLLDQPFVWEMSRGLAVDTSKFRQIADFLYYNCDYSREQIRVRLKHYEGWDDHDWAPSHW